MVMIDIYIKKFRKIRNNYNLKGLKMEKKENMWSIKDEILSLNTDLNKKKYDIVDGDEIASNIDGFVINADGFIVAKFGFFVQQLNEDTLDLKISRDGFLGGLYNKPTSLVIGYGSKLGFNCLVDIEKTVILDFKPEYVDEDIILNIENDDKLKNEGMLCIIRDIDVDLEMLQDDVKNDFLQSQKESIDTTKLNELELSFKSYISHVYKLLSKQV